MAKLVRNSKTSHCRAQMALSVAPWDIGEPVFWVLGPGCTQLITLELLSVEMFLNLNNRSIGP